MLAYQSQLFRVHNIFTFPLPLSQNPVYVDEALGLWSHNFSVLKLEIPGVSVQHHWQSCRGPLGHWHLITWTCCRGLLTSVSPSACLQCIWPYSPSAADHKYSSHPSAAYPSRQRQLPIINFKHFCCVFFSVGLLQFGGFCSWTFLLLSFTIPYTFPVSLMLLSTVGSTMNVVHCHFFAISDFFCIITFIDKLPK